MEYEVTGNISHNGRAYAAGDTIDLAEEQAQPLIEVGALEDPNEPEEEQPEAPRAKKQKKDKKKGKEDGPVVGGERTESGEPSLDSADEEKIDAEDITPPVANPGEPSLDVSADL